MKRLILLAVVAVVPAIMGCSFAFDPAARARYYRVEGWSLPGIKDVPGNFLAPSSWAHVRGVTASLLQHKQPYISEFPSQVFTLDGSSKKMKRIVAKAHVVRWSMNEKVFAYSYDLVPVSASRVNGEWVVDATAGCVFDGTFIDDKGDGLFRVLVPGMLSDDLVPEWVKGPQSN